jgi:hypothetical protein
MLRQEQFESQSSTDSLLSRVIQLLMLVLTLLLMLFSTIGGIRVMGRGLLRFLSLKNLFLNFKFKKKIISQMSTSRD